jgi:hypothetical protein
LPAARITMLMAFVDMGLSIKQKRQPLAAFDAHITH